MNIKPINIKDFNSFKEMESKCGEDEAENYILKLARNLDYGYKSEEIRDAVRRVQFDEAFDLLKKDAKKE